MCPESILPSKMEGSLQACTYLGWSGKKQHPEVCQESTGKAVKGGWLDKSPYLRCQNRGTAGQIPLCSLRMNPSQTPLQKHVGLGALGWVAGVTHIMYGVLTAPPAPRPVPTRWKGTSA